MQKVIFILAALLTTGIAAAQGNLPGSHVAQDNVPVVEMSDIAESFVVAKEQGTDILFLSAASTGLETGEIIAAYVSSDDDDNQSVKTIKSADGGRTWTTPKRIESRSEGKYNSLSMFRLGRRVERNRNLNLPGGRGGNILFIGEDGGICTAISPDAGESWSEPCPVSFSGNFRVSSLVRLRDGRIMALFHYNDMPYMPDTKRAKSVIFKMYSADGGVSWTLPEIAVKHNTKGLYDAAAIRMGKPGKKGLMMITGQRPGNMSMASYSTDNGKTWVYPVALPEFIHGDMFATAYHRKRFYVAYRDLCYKYGDGTLNPTYGDLVLWSGKPDKVAGGKETGTKMRIFNSETPPGRYPENEVGDHGYVSLMVTGRDKLSMIARGRWDEGEEIYGRCFTLDTRQMRRMMRKAR